MRGCVLMSFLIEDAYGDRACSAQPQDVSFLAVITPISTSGHSQNHNPSATHMPERASRAGYQPLSQDVDGEAEVGLLEADVGAQQSAVSTRGLRRSGRPGNIDLKKLDNAFKRYALCL